MRIAALLVLAASGTLPGQVMQWTRFEASLNASGDYTNPLQDVSLSVEFLSPSGQRHTVSAFWDGGSVWRVRFSPDETGAWRWSTRSEPTDAGLNGRSGTFECVPYAGPNPLYLHGALRVSGDGHRFHQADGSPFFWLGDTVWNGPLLADARDWEVFLKDREDKGFNVIQFVTTRWSAAYADASGRIPYTGRDRIELDPAFFQRLDTRVDAINQHGMFAAPVLLWAHASQPELNPGIQLPESQMILLARYMVARYGAHQVVWFLNGDGQYAGANADKWKRVGRAVFANTQPSRLATMHPGRMTWMTDDFAGEPWFHFTGYQSGHRDDEQHLRWLTQGPPSKDWTRPKPIPAINLEPNYEAHRSRTAGATHVFTDFHVRRAAWWSVLVAPAAGVTYGAHGIWSWESQKGEPLHHRGTGPALPWREAMKLPGSSDMQRLKTFMTELPWASLLPAQELLAEQPGDKDAQQFIAVARTDDTIVAYLPAGGRVRFKSVEGFRRARWYDPRSGAWSGAALQSAAFDAPGAGDWVLVLDKAADRPRLVVLTDIGGDPDDQQSMVRLMTYTNEFDVEGLIASASGTPGELKQHLVRPDLIREIIGAYGQVRPNLTRHAAGYPHASQLLSAVKSGNRFRGAAAIGKDGDTEGSRWLISVADRPDPRPVNVAIWGGPTDLAQALWRVRNDRDAAGLRQFVSKLRVYSIGHQDDSGPWIVENFPDLFYVLAAADPNDVSGRPQKGPDRRQSVYRGMYLTGDESLTSRTWIDEHVRSNHGPLGALYPAKTWTAPNPHGVLKEGDTPSWFYFLALGLSDASHPDWGGWGGRFRPVRNGLWNDAPDTLQGTSDARFSVSRWRPAFQNDLAARMDWCASADAKGANHQPEAVLNGDLSRSILTISTTAGDTVHLSAAGSHDPDNDRLSYRWYVYKEAGTYSGDLRLQPDAEQSAALVAPSVSSPQTIHVILEVTDTGRPPLTSFRRAVITIQPSQRQK